MYRPLERVVLSDKSQIQPLQEVYIQYIYQYQGKYVQIGDISLRKHGFLGNGIIIVYKLYILVITWPRK